MASDDHDPSPADSHESIFRRRDAELVRMRPAMYIGSTSDRGLEHILTRLVLNSLVEVAAGHGRSVRVTFLPDGSAEVADDGRPSPSDCSYSGFPSLDPVHVRPYGRPTTGRDWFDYFVANALSERFEVVVRHEGEGFRQEFSGGEPLSPLERLGRSPERVFTVAFKPDPSIFQDAQFPIDAIRERLRRYAFLQSGVSIAVSVRVSGQEECFTFEDGVRAYVRHLDAGRHPLHDEVIVVHGERGGVRFEVGLRWSDESDTIEACHANNELTGQGGTHLTGLRTAVTRSLNDFIREHLPAIRPLTGSRVREGLTAVVSVWLDDPRFEGATRERLGSNEARRAIEAGVGPALSDYFRANPGVAERIVRAALARPIGPPMSEEDWLNCADPIRLTRFVDGFGSRRQAILFAVACCRFNVRVKGNRRDLEVLAMLEEYADGISDVQDNASARGASRRVGHMIQAVRRAPFGPLDAARVARMLLGDRQGERAEQADLVREVFGNPFRPVTIDPNWRTSTIVGLATGIYVDRAFDRLSILADALEDAGCDQPDILAHCRADGEHARGCWVIDAVLGKS